MQPDALLRPPPPVMQTERPFLQCAGAFLALAATPDALRPLRRRLRLPDPKTKGRSARLRAMQTMVRVGP